MKVFNGTEFLDAKSVQVKLTNGKEFVVREIPIESMDELSKLTDESSSSIVRDTIAKACSVPKTHFAGIGIVELRGVIDFLLENLLSTKSPT